MTKLLCRLENLEESLEDLVVISESCLILSLINPSELITQMVHIPRRKCLQSYMQYISCYRTQYFVYFKADMWINQCLWVASFPGLPPQAFYRLQFQDAEKAGKAGDEASPWAYILCSNSVQTTGFSNASETHSTYFGCTKDTITESNLPFPIKRW